MILFIMMTNTRERVRSNKTMQVCVVLLPKTVTSWERGGVSNAIALIPPEWRKGPGGPHTYVPLFPESFLAFSAE